MREALRSVGLVVGSVLRAADSPRGIFLTGVGLVAIGAGHYSLPAASIVAGSLFLAVAFLGMWPRQPRGER